jgi:uncharacterized membrane protein
MFAATYITVDPAWPWSLPGIGASALFGVVLALAALTVWSYLGHHQATSRRIGIVLLLRLLALAIALIVILRPSLAHDEDDNSLASKLLVHLDISDSMNITDEFNNLSRYEHAKRLLTTPSVADLLKKLSHERKIEIAYTMGADDVKPLDFPAKPFGKRTDIGRWLHELWLRHGNEPNLRGLVLLSDGADNGVRFAALDEAAKFRGVCPIFPFALGQTTTTTAHKDVAIDKLFVEEPVHAKSELKVTATLAAPGFDDAVLNVSLWIEDQDGKTMKQLGARQTVDLRRLPDKTVRFKAEAPDKDGEVKVTVKVDSFPGEVNLANNESSTYVNVSKDGVRILWVEGRPRYEPRFAMEALSRDRRFRVFRTIKQLEAKPGATTDDFFNFDKRPYDVIVIGDISAQRFSGGKPEILDKIVQMVQIRGTGLLMLAGYDTFAAGGWHNSRLAPLLPGRLDQTEQVETKIKVTPTPEGEQFLLKLSPDPVRQKELWSTKFAALEGMTPLGAVLPTATVYAKGETATGKVYDLMASVDRGQGRVMAFGGDTTHLSWRRSREAIAAYETFWIQLMLWLAKQEHSKGNLAVRPDTRRLDLTRTDRLGFSVQFTQGAVAVKQPTFKAKIVGPKKDEYPVNVLPEASEFRGTWSGPPMPGEYRIVVEGQGLDDKDQPVAGTDSARFVVYDEDRENLRPAADHDLLQKIASAGGGRFSLAEERKLVQFLEELPALQDASRASATRWPDWRRNPTSNAVRDQVLALWQSSALVCFLSFTALLCLEWWLRRRWGMV